jgi:hypothetical protein
MKELIRKHNKIMLKIIMINKIMKKMKLYRLINSKSKIKKVILIT